MACKCVVMSKLLAHLGAKHAAEMHLQPNAVWTTRDYLIHFEEEDKYVDPALRVAGAIAEADQIALVHDMLRAQIRIYGRIVNKKMLDDHAAFEDEVVLKYLGHLVGENASPAARVGRSMRDWR